MIDEKRLRVRAEELTKSEGHADLKSAEIPLKEALHELKVHQIELELQNEELRDTVGRLEELKTNAEKSRNAFIQLYDSTQMGFVVINDIGMICHCNATALNWFKLPERKFFHRPFVDLIHAEDKAQWRIRWKGFMRQPENKQMELRMLFVGDRVCYVEIQGKKLNDWFKNDFLRCDEETSDYYLLSINDVDERKKAEEQLTLAASVFENSAEGIVITNAENQITSVNPAFSRITGYSLADVYGKNPSVLASGKHDQAYYQSMWELLLSQGHWQGEIWNRRKSGEVYPEWLTLRVMKDISGRIFRYIAIFSDISSQKKVQNLMNYQATHDALTGLPNRILFYDRLQQSLRQAKRNKTFVALFFMDLDGFKGINDSLGHSVGDELLVGVAKRINEMVRCSDTFARLGGDEFVVILNDLRAVSQVTPIAQKILEKVSQPFPSSQGELSISGSLGIAIYPKDAEACENLVQYADNAMYAAKKSGRNQLHFFKKEMQLATEQKYQLEQELKSALRLGQLDVFFQPIIDLLNDNIVGAESLVRWRHPIRGLLEPDQFIPLAEESGLIGQLGNLVVEKALVQAEAWQEVTGLPPLYLTMNMSAQQFRLDPHCSTLLQIIERHRFPADRIVIEITESVMMLSDKDCLSVLNRLRDRGIRIFLDDFGTGFSSLSYLKKLPVDRVKIDRSFIKDILVDVQNAALVEAIISMTHKLSLETIAEGIETKEQASYLIEHGCTYGQGYHFGKPMRPEQFLALITSSSHCALTSA